MMGIETIFDPAHWHEWRRTGIGASEAAAVAGQSDRPTRVEIWLEKLGKAGPRPEPNEAMRWGHRLEDDIAEAYTEATGIPIIQTQVCCRSDSRPWMIATVDGVAQDRLVEFKATGHWAAKQLGESGDVETLPLRWIIQAQHQMACYGADRVDFAVFLPSLELRTYPVERSELLIDSLWEIEAEFWECVKSETPPPTLDVADCEHLLRYYGNHETRVELDHSVLTAVDMYEHAASEIRELELVKGQTRARIIAALGRHKYGDLPDGRVVTASVANISERIQTVRAHTQVRLSVRAPKPETVNSD
jgi:putative phage-type endonuclease